MKSARRDAHRAAPRAMFMGARDRDRRKLKEGIRAREFPGYRRRDYRVGYQRQVIAMLLEASNRENRACCAASLLVRCCRGRQDMIHQPAPRSGLNEST